MRGEAAEKPSEAPKTYLEMSTHEDSAKKRGSEFDDSDYRGEKDTDDGREQRQKEDRGNHTEGEGSKPEK